MWVSDLQKCFFPNNVHPKGIPNCRSKIPAPSHALMPPAAFDVLATHQQIYTKEHEKYGRGKMSLRPSQKPIKKKKKLFFFLNSGGFLVQKSWNHGISSRRQEQCGHCGQFVEQHSHPTSVERVSSGRSCDGETCVKHFKHIQQFILKYIRYPTMSFFDPSS